MTKPDDTIVDGESHRLANQQPKLDWEALLERAQQLFQSTFRGTELPDPTELINGGRQERDDAIFGLKEYHSSNKQTGLNHEADRERD